MSCLDRREDADVQAGGVVVLEVSLHTFDEQAIVGTLRIEPEHCRSTSGTRTIHGQLDPVTYRQVTRLAHAPDVALLHAVLRQHSTAAIHHAHLAVGRDLEGLIV